MNIYLDFISTMKVYIMQWIIMYFIIVQILMIFHKENQNRSFVIFMVFHEFINSIFDTFSNFMLLLKLEQLLLIMDQNIFNGKKFIMKILSILTPFSQYSHCYCYFFCFENVISLSIFHLILVFTFIQSIF